MSYFKYEVSRCLAYPAFVAIPNFDQLLDSDIHGDGRKAVRVNLENIPGGCHLFCPQVTGQWPTLPNGPTTTFWASYGRKIHENMIKRTSELQNVIRAQL
jgi:hypothetical protein